MRSSFILLGLLTLVIAAARQAAAGEESAEWVVPTRMCGQYYLIPLEVDLDADGRPTTWLALFDTGGAGLHVDPDSVVRAGGAPVAEGRQITVRKATAGRLTFRKLRPHVRELDHLSRPLGIQVDVFLPFRAFREHLLTLDFPKREMRIARGRLRWPDDVEVFDARGPDRRPYLVIDVAGRRHQLLIDSGSTGSIGLQPGRDLPWMTEPRPVSVSQGMEQLIYSQLGRLDDNIVIARVEVLRPLVAIRNLTELLGTSIMRHFAWTFDQKARRVRIRGPSTDPLRLPPRRGVGAVYKPTASGYEIVRVLESTPAEEAGLQPGDVVIAIDGKPVYEYGCERWDEEHATDTSLTILRQGDRFRSQLEIVDIVP